MLTKSSCFYAVVCVLIQAFLLSGFVYSEPTDNGEMLEENMDPLREDRPWGYYRVLDEGENYKVKQIVVYPKKRLSLQLHHKRAERWVIVKGVAKITLGEDTLEKHENENLFIPKLTKHRVENTGIHNLEFIEVQTGEYLGEDDIVRFEDDYGRINS